MHRTLHSCSAVSVGVLVSASWTRFSVGRVFLLCAFAGKFPISQDGNLLTLPYCGTAQTRATQPVVAHTGCYGDPACTGRT